jgi:ABC-type sugar transport system, periplasmic component
MVMYRTDLFQKAGLTMPEKPTWDFVIDAANKLTDKSGGVYGICLRGKAGWGENMAFLTAMSNSFGARWFDEKWQPQFDKPEWKKTLTTYVDLMKAAALPAPARTASMKTWRCSIPANARCGSTPRWRRPLSPTRRIPRSPTRSASRWRRMRARQERQLAVGVESGDSRRSKKTAAAEKFIAWATSKDYTKLVASKEGWSNVPPGTRTSLYQNPEYLKVAPFAKLTLASIDAADPNKPTVQPVPMSACNTRHSGIPGHRHHRRPAILGGVGRFLDGRCALAAAQTRPNAK